MGFAALIRLYGLSSVGLFALALACLASAWSLPPANFKSGESQRRISSGQAPKAVEKPSLKLQDFDLLIRTPLQRPLVDPQPVVADPPVERTLPPPQLDLSLVGTAVESDQSLSRAWLQNPLGEELMLRIGDPIEGIQPAAKVKAISKRSIAIEVAGQLVEIGQDK